MVTFPAPLFSVLLEWPLPLAPAIIRQKIGTAHNPRQRSSGSLLRIEKEGGQVLWNVRFRRGELSYLDFGFPSSSRPSVLANCSCGKVCLDRTTAARWGPLSPCGG